MPSSIRACCVLSCHSSNCYEISMKLARFRNGIVVVGLVVLASGPALAQDLPEEHETRLSREDWIARVEAARQRIEQMRREHKSFVPVEEQPVDEAEDASKRVLGDETLRTGDVVTTAQGFFRFTGQHGADRNPADFVPLGRQNGQKPD
jgi:hypothetical protein